ncbi:MAG TPA: carboxypeptidase-like regulatory domain-containing protein, partial [Puia sp.]|nr:carboxypeptidase-like regulatory domain-containing protein [Puia sp.]
MRRQLLEKCTLRLCLGAILLIAVFHGHAQERIVTGTVTGKDNGQPLAGVTVAAKDGDISAQTNNEGRFSIRLPGGSGSLLFSYVGYGSIELPVTRERDMVVLLNPNAKEMADVVVSSGYSTQR